MSIVVDEGPEAGSSPVALYALPARAWHRAEYAAMQQSALGASLAVLSEPAGGSAWAARSVDQLARRAAAVILERERACGGERGRPVVLLGWSVGALVALQAAQRLSKELQVAWVGALDASVYPEVRARLAQLPALPEEELQRLEQTLARWLSHSPMRPHWQALLGAMTAVSRHFFLLEVVAAYGTALPTDGPAPGSAEYTLWSRINCLRLGVDYRWPDTLDVPVRWWASAEGEASSRALIEQVGTAPATSSPVVLQHSDHLQLPADPVLHRSLFEAVYPASSPLPQA